MIYGEVTGIEVVVPTHPSSPNSTEIRFYRIPNIFVKDHKPYDSFFFFSGGVGNHEQGPDGLYQIQSLNDSTKILVFPDGNVKVERQHSGFGPRNPPNYRLPPDLTKKFRQYIENLHQPKNNFNKSKNAYENELTPVFLKDDSLFINFTNEQLERYIDEGRDVNAVDATSVTLWYILLMKAVNYSTRTLEPVDEEGRFIFRLLDKLFEKDIGRSVRGFTFIGLAGYFAYAPPVWANSLPEEIDPRYRQFFEAQVGRYIMSRYEEHRRMHRVKRTVEITRNLDKFGLPEVLRNSIVASAGEEPVRPGNIGVVNYLAQKKAAAVNVPARAGAGAAASNARRRSRKHRGGAKRRKLSRKSKIIRKH